MLGGGTKRRQSKDIDAAKAAGLNIRRVSVKLSKEFIMALTKSFKDRVQTRAETDPDFSVWTSH